MDLIEILDKKKLNPAKKLYRSIFNRETRRKTIWLLFLFPALAVYLVFMAAPLIDSLRLSLYSGVGLTPTKFVGLQNFIDLFTNPLWRGLFFGAVLHTCIFFAIHMTVQNTLGLLFAALLVSNFRGRDTFRAIIFAPATFSVLVVGFLWTLILNPSWGAVNTILTKIGLSSFALAWLGDARVALPVISLTSAWQWVGMPTMMFLAGLVGVPEELVEAARVDGASEWTAFWKIKFPLLMPVVGIVAVITFVDNFNAFDVIFAMAGVRGTPNYATDLLATLFYRVGIAGEQPSGLPNMGIGAAIATMIFLILMIGVSLWLFVFRRQTPDQM
jgi:raffinose/stachyose/melibiose transport system permease protein